MHNRLSMMLLAFGMSVIAGASFAADAQGTSQKPCQLLEVASLPMTPLAEGRFTVPMTVAGKQLNMLIDTGDDLSTLTDEAADGLGLKINHSTITPFSTVHVEDGLTVMDFVSAEGVQLGNIRGDGKYVFGIRPEARSIGYDGSLGIAFLRNYDIDLDFGNKKFNLFSKDHCPGNVVYWTKGPVAVVPGILTGDGRSVELYFKVELDGKTLDATLDASAPRSFMDWDRAKLLFDLDDKNPAVTTLSAGGGPDRFMYKYPFKALSLGGVTVNNPDVKMLPAEVSDMTASYSADPWIVIGANVLHQLHIYIANGENKLYVTPASAH